MENSELTTTVPSADEMWSSSGFDCDCGSPPEFYLPPPPRPPFMSEYFCNENSINPEFESCDTLPIIDASYRSGPSIPMSAVFVLCSLLLAFIICISIIIVWKHKRKMRNFPSCKKSSQQQNCGGDVVGSTTVQAPNVIYEDLNDVLQQQQQQQHQRQQRDRNGRRSGPIIAAGNRFGYGSDYSSGHTKHSSMEMIDVKNIHYPSGYTMTMNTPIFLCSSPGPDPYCSQELYNRIYEELSDAETELAHGSEDEFAEDELSLNNNHSNTFANCNTLESKRLQKLQLLNHNCNCSFNLTNTLPAALKWTQTANTKDNQRCLQQQQQQPHEQQPLTDMTSTTCGLYSVKRPHHHHHPNPHPHHQYYQQQQQQQQQQQPYCCMPINTISSGHCDFQNCTSSTIGPKRLNYRNQNEFHEGIIFDSFLQMYPNHTNDPKNQKTNSNTNSTNRSSFGKKLKTTLTKSRKLRSNLSRVQVSQQQQQLQPQQHSSLPIAINKMVLSSPATAPTTTTTATALCCNNSTSSNCSRSSSSNSSNTTMTAASAAKANERHHFENPYETVPVSYDQLLALHQHQQQQQQQQQHQHHQHQHQQHNRNISKLPKLYSQDSAFGSDSGYSNNTTTTTVSAVGTGAATAATATLNRTDSKRFSLTIKNDELS